MKCKNCGGELRFENGIAVCQACNAKYQADYVFRDDHIHICYVENDSNGRRTKDSVLAQELFQKLSAKNIDAFYERISAENQTGDDLELIRYSSIYSSKVILIVGASVDNYNLIYSKYSSFFAGKVIIPIVSDIKPTDIPKELRKIQVLDFASIGWEKDLEKSLYNLLGRENEIDLAESHRKHKKAKIAIISIISAIVLAGIGIFSFMLLNKQKEPDAPAQLSNQEIYDNAQSEYANGNYLEAFDLFSKILDYKDSRKQVESILNRYDGYYTTDDKLFSIYFNIKNASELSVEMTSVSAYGTANATVSGIWNAIQESYSFTDSFGNPGQLSITLENEGLNIDIKMEKDGDFASIGTRNVTFKLTDKSDKPAILQITPELLLSWVQDPTTISDINAAGFELEKDNNFKVTAGGAALSNADLYRIANTDVQLFFYSKDLSDQLVLYDETKTNSDLSDKQIVCAVFATAEDLIPNKINDENGMFIENDTMFVTGGNTMNIDWGGTDIFILFDTDSFSYSPSGKIAADTKVGVICRKIVGNGFFVRDALLHKNQRLTNKYQGPLIAEKDDGYIMLEDYRSGRAYKVDKTSFEIIDRLDVYECFVSYENLKIYNQPSYDGQIVGTLPKGWCYSLETKADQNGNLWGKLIDNSGWICITAIESEDEENYNEYLTDSPESLLDTFEDFGNDEKIICPECGRDCTFRGLMDNGICEDCNAKQP